MDIAATIFNQLGGNGFVVMTGASMLVGMKDGLAMHLPRNASKANRLKIIYDEGQDLYDMIFTKYTPFKVRNGKFYEEKQETVRTFKGIFCDQLQELFTEVTGMYTHF